MYVLINGAFGVGKTSVAQELRRLVPKSVIFNPENVGFILQRLPGHHESDFQHLPAWRRLTVLGAKLVGSARTTVIVPMAFSEHRYIKEVPTGLS